MSASRQQQKGVSQKTVRYLLDLLDGPQGPPVKRFLTSILDQQRYEQMTGPSIKQIDEQWQNRQKIIKKQLQDMGESISNVRKQTQKSSCYFKLAKSSFFVQSDAVSQQLKDCHQFSWLQDQYQHAKKSLELYCKQQVIQQRNFNDAKSRLNILQKQLLQIMKKRKNLQIHAKISENNYKKAVQNKVMCQFYLKNIEFSLQSCEFKKMYYLCQEVYKWVKAKKKVNPTNATITFKEKIIQSQKADYRSKT